MPSGALGFKRLLPKAFDLKLSISRLIILPNSPEPFTEFKLIPFSSANFFAKGEAIILPFEFSFVSIN